MVGPASEWRARPLEHLDGSLRTRWRKAIATPRDEAGVERVDTIEVLDGVQRFDDVTGVETGGQRQLQDDAAHIRVAAEIAEGRADGLGV